MLDEENVEAARTAAFVRCCDHRSWDSRPGDCLLPVQASWRQENRAARQGLSRQRQQRPQYRYSAIQLSHTGRHSFADVHPSSYTNKCLKMLGWNVLFTQCGHLTLAHTDASLDWPARAGRKQSGSRCR